MIRKASVDDLEALYNIEKICFGKERYTKDFITHLLQAENIITLVKEKDELVVGSITFSFNKIMRIISIAVMPEFRRNGFGRALLKEAEKCAIQRRIDKIILEVGVRNSIALNFYLVNNYKIDSTIPHYYPDQDGYRMSKSVK